MFSFKQQVQGEIFEVDHNVLSVLEELEGHPKWYKRTLCEIIATATAAVIFSRLKINYHVFALRLTVLVFHWCLQCI